MRSRNSPSDRLCSIVPVPETETHTSHTYTYISVESMTEYWGKECGLYRLGNEE